MKLNLKTSAMILITVLLTVFNAVFLSSCLEKKYNVIFDPSGGHLVSGELEQKVIEGEDAVVPVVEREGFKFQCWLPGFADIKSDTKIFAEWSEIFTVTFDANGGTVISGSATVEVLDGGSAEPPKVERDGYDFTGWDTDTSSVHSDVTVKAMWKRQKLTSEEIYTLARQAVVTVEGYDRTGWGVQAPDFLSTTTVLL